MPSTCQVASLRVFARRFNRLAALRGHGRRVTFKGHERIQS